VFNCHPVFWLVGNRNHPQLLQNRDVANYAHGRPPGVNERHRLMSTVRNFCTAGESTRSLRESRTLLLQLRVLRLRFFEDWDVEVGVFPEGEEVLIGGVSLSSVAG